MFTFDRFQVFPNAKDDVTFYGQVRFEADTLASEGQKLSITANCTTKFKTS